jgi:hypothetical protein
MVEVMNGWLEEQLKTTRNLCDTALILIHTNNQKLLPTILETLYEQTQQIVDENCVMKDELETHSN